MIDRLAGRLSDVDRGLDASGEGNLRLDGVEREGRFMLVQRIGVRIYGGKRALGTFRCKIQYPLRRREKHAVCAQLGRRVAQRSALGETERVDVARELDHAIVQVEIERPCTNLASDVEADVARI